MATPAHKGFQKGAEHHLVKGITQAKADVIARVKAGVSVQAAMVAVEKVCPEAHRLLIIPENHTRNIYYLKNLKLVYH